MRKKKIITSGTESDIPNSLFVYRGYAQTKKAPSPERKALNLSASMGTEKNENNYFRNCNNTYFIHGEKQLTKEGRSKEKLQVSLRPGAQTAKRKSSKQQVISSVNPFMPQSKPKNRSKSKEDIVVTEGNISNLLSNCIMLPKKSRKIE